MEGRPFEPTRRQVQTTKMSAALCTARFPSHMMSRGNVFYARPRVDGDGECEGMAWDGPRGEEGMVARASGGRWSKKEGNDETPWQYQASSNETIGPQNSN
jgi:hypothetical protein